VVRNYSNNIGLSKVVNKCAVGTAVVIAFTAVYS
jgi:hypothetical protein